MNVHTHEAADGMAVRSLTDHRARRIERGADAPATGPKRRARRRRVAAAVAGVGVAAAASVLSSSPASAAFATNSWISSNSGGANLRSCPSTGCGRLGYMANGTRVGMMCWIDSQWVYPPNSNYASPRWFKVGTYALGGSIGYVHSSLVANQTSVPRC